MTNKETLHAQNQAIYKQQ